MRIQAVLLLFFIAVQLATMPAAANGLLPVWDGESDASRLATNFQYGKTVTTSPQQGRYCFEGAPDSWNAPAISLAGQPSFRSDWSQYDELRFYARADSVGHDLTVTLESWIPSHLLSRSVSVAPFIEGGKLDTNWRLVRIPIAALKSANYRLESVERIYFGTANPPATSYRIHVDSIQLADSSGLQIKKVEALSDRTLRLTVSGRYDMNDALTINNYRLQGPSGAIVTPQQIGRRYYLSQFQGPAEAFLKNPSAPVVTFELYLSFASPLLNGNWYELVVVNVRDSAGNSFNAPQTLRFYFDDRFMISGSVKVNQVGYLPEGAKYAYLGNYRGDAGAMPIAPKSCEVKGAANAGTVLTVPARFRAVDPALSGEVVYECDFSALRTAGRYYIYAPGLGRSYDFVIDPGVYNQAFKKLARLYYYQRSAMDIAPPFAGAWPRKAGHTITDAAAIIHPSQANSPLYSNEPINGRINLLRGWYDAADYGKYSITMGPTVFELLMAFELFPDRFVDGTLSIPESGNGIPDLLDEVKWGIDWFKEMQAPDGGVYDRVVTTSYASTLPEADTGPRYVAEKTTHTTAGYAAAMAQAYRNFLPYWPDYARDLLRRAEKAWSFLLQHPSAQPAGGFRNPPGIGGGSYVDADGDADSRAWAAAELYKATGKKGYHDAFLALWLPGDPNYGWNDFAQQQKRASQVYATTKTYPVNQNYVDRYKAALRRDITVLVQRTFNNVYRNAFDSSVPAWIGWGAFSNSARYAWQLIKASQILGDAGLIEAARINLDAQLGSNPQNISYITGVGSRYPRDPLHTISALDGVEEPVPGIPVYGIFVRMEEANPYKAAAQSSVNLYPAGREATDPYPLLHRYYDVSELVEMSEFSIGDLANIVSAFAFFSNPRATPLQERAKPRAPERIRAYQE